MSGVKEITRLFFPELPRIVTFHSLLAQAVCLLNSDQDLICTSVAIRESIPRVVEGNAPVHIDYYAPCQESQLDADVPERRLGYSAERLWLFNVHDLQEISWQHPDPDSRKETVTTMFNGTTAERAAHLSIVPRIPLETLDLEYLEVSLAIGGDTVLDQKVYLTAESAVDAIKKAMLS